tara:strand:- start:1889 stop:2191 length:303 start_codon:yes stop_codon:yes gene_type:complete
VLPDAGKIKQCDILVPREIVRIECALTAALLNLWQLRGPVRRLDLLNFLTPREVICLRARGFLAEAGADYFGLVITRKLRTGRRVFVNRQYAAISKRYPT